jgi:hypothetical protein
MCIAHDPGSRLRDIASMLDITERTAYGIVTDLSEGGYVVKEKDGRRNRYQIQDHLPLPEPIIGERTIGEVLDLLVDTNTRRRRRGKGE